MQIFIIYHSGPTRSTLSARSRLLHASNGLRLHVASFDVFDRTNSREFSRSFGERLLGMERLPICLSTTGMKLVDKLEWTQEGTSFWNSSKKPHIETVGIADAADAILADVGAFLVRLLVGYQLGIVLKTLHLTGDSNEHTHLIRLEKPQLEFAIGDVEIDVFFECHLPELLGKIKNGSLHSFDVLDAGL